MLSISFDAVAALCGVVTAAVTYFVVGEVTRPFPPGSVRGIAERSDLLYRIMGLGWHLHYDEAFRYHLNMLRQMKTLVPIALRTFWMPRLLLLHPADVEYVLIGNERNYTKGAAYEVLQTILGKGLVTLLDHEEHAKQRKLCGPAFSPNALRRIAAGTMATQAMTLIKTLKQLIDENAKSSGAERGSQSTTEFNVRDLVNRTALNIIAEAAFRADSSTVSEVADEFLHITRDGFNVTRLIPFVNRIPTTSQRRLKAARARIVAFLERAAEDVRREARDAGVNASDIVEQGSGQALVDYLVFAEGMSREQLADHAITVAFAGHETSASALNWLLVLLAHHPDVQERLFEELSETFARGVAPSIDTLRTSCPYLTCVLTELLRLYPIAPAIGRAAVEDDVLPGSRHFVPKNMTVIVNIFTMQRSVEIYGDDADVFRPSRWEGAEGRALEARVGRCWYMPFSLGPRNCIGAAFAMMELQMIAAVLVRNFVFAWPAGQPFPKRRFIITLQTDKTYPLLATLRKD